MTITVSQLYKKKIGHILIHMQQRSCIAFPLSFFSLLCNFELPLGFSTYQVVDKISYRTRSKAVLKSRNTIIVGFNTFCGSKLSRSCSSSVPCCRTILEDFSPMCPVSSHSFISRERIKHFQKTWKFSSFHKLSNIKSRLKYWFVSEMVQSLFVFFWARTKTRLFLDICSNEYGLTSIDSQRFKRITP